MQNQILGFFIVTTVALGVLCGVFWQQRQDQVTQAYRLRQQIEETSLEMDGQRAEVQSLQRDRERVDRKIAELTAGLTGLRQASNELASALAQQRAAAGGQSTSSVLSAGQVLAELVAQQFQTALDGTPHPLRQEQLLQLLTRAAEENRNLPVPEAAGGDHATQAQELAYQERQHELVRRVWGAAQQVLQPPQWQWVSRFQTNQAAVQELSRQVVRSLHPLEEGAPPKD